MSFSKRAGLLASEFQRFGMPEPEATSLSSEMVLRHPLAHRVGVPVLARRFVRLGLEPEDAIQMALTVWCLERLMLGHCFQDLLERLRRAGVEEQRALPACIEARRLWRNGGAGLQPVDLDRMLVRWCVPMLAAALAAHLLARLAA